MDQVLLDILHESIEDNLVNLAELLLTYRIGGTSAEDQHIQPNG